MMLVFPCRLNPWRTRDHWCRAWRSARRLVVPALVLLLLYGIWPYTTLWRLNRALLERDQAVIASLVDIEAIRDEIGRRLNKDRHSVIDTLSDPFIHWLERGIRRSGRHALEDLVTIDWVREQLRVRSPDGEGFLAATSHAGFDGPLGFRVRVGAPEAEPLTLRLRFGGLGWRVVTLYY